MSTLTPNTRAAAEKFEPLSVEEKERLLGVMSDAQRVLARLPVADARFDRATSEGPDFLAGLADRIAEYRFEAVLEDANIDEETRLMLRGKAAAEGGIVPLLKKRLEPTPTFVDVAPCVSGAVLLVGGAAIALSSVDPPDIPLIAFGLGLASVGAYAVGYSCFS